MNKAMAMIGIGCVMSGLVACQNGESKEITLPATPVALGQATPPKVSTKQATLQSPINGQAISAGTTVASLGGLPDDSMVKLTGKLVRALGDERYEFSDGTGTIIVEIDNELWGGRAIGVNDVLTISGELDKSLNPLERLEIDVDFVEF